MSQRIPLNKFATVLRGATPAPKEDFIEGTPFIGQTEVGRGGIQPLRRVDLQSVDDFAEPTYLLANDLVVASTDSQRRVLMVTESTEGAVLGRECLAVRLEVRWRPVSAGYLHAWMKTDDFRRQADTLATGITTPRLTQRSLGSIEVPLLDLVRQDWVVRLSKKFETSTKSLRTTLAQMEELESLELELAFLEGQEGA